MMTKNYSIPKWSSFMKSLLAMMMIMMTVAMIGCAEQQGFDNTSMNTTVTETNVEGFDNLMAKARWGDGNAYLKLAECYTKGEGVKADFLATMTMLTLARDYGGIYEIKDFVHGLPEDNNTRMTFEAMEKLDLDKQVEAMGIADELIAKGCTDGYALKSFIYYERKDSIQAMQMASIATEQGSTLGKAILLVPTMTKGMQDEELLAAQAEEIPTLYRILAEEYARRAYWEPEYKEKAAKYYLKADEMGILDPGGAGWLLTYIKEGGDLPLSDTDLQRLKELGKDFYITPYIEKPNTNMGLWEQDLPEPNAADTTFIKKAKEATMEYEKMRIEEHSKKVED